MWGSLRLIQQHGAWHYCQECIQIRDVSTKVDAPKGSYECLHMVTILHIEIMRWMCYECHLCMALAWSDLNHYAQFYCLWAACPCLSWFVVAQIKSKLPSTLQLESSSLWVSFMLTLHSGIVYGCKQAYTHACTMHVFNDIQDIDAFACSGIKLHCQKYHKWRLYNARWQSSKPVCVKKEQNGPPDADQELKCKNHHVTPTHFLLSKAQSLSFTDDVQCNIAGSKLDDAYK